MHQGLMQTYLESMFTNASSFYQDLSKSIVKSWTDMCRMFENATSFNHDFIHLEKATIYYAQGVC
jgi:Mycoplasma protein of unknown function, DUF285